MPLNREELDRQVVEASAPVVFTCSTHPGIPVTALYQDGVMRLLCPACGFEICRVKVASAQPNQHSREGR